MKTKIASSIYFLCCLAITCTFASTFTFAADVEVDSRVTSVTLFSQGAEIIRSGKVQLEPGESRLIFRNIPQGLESDSLRAGGKGTTKIQIQGVDLRTRRRLEDISPAAEDIHRQIEALVREIAIHNRTKSRLENERTLVSSIKLDLLAPSEGSEKIVRPRSASEMTALLGFISQNTAKQDEELRSVEDKLIDLQKRLEVLKAAAAKFLPGNKTESVVEMLVNTDKPSTVEVNLSYQVRSAGWSPTYNLLLSTEKGSPDFVVETYGVVRQNTGEDWSKISLLLSTARPHVSLTRPVPGPRVLDIFTPMPLANAPASRLLGKVARMQSQKMNAGAMPSSDSFSDLAIEEASTQEEFDEPVAQLEPGALLTYSIPSLVSIRSDGTVEKVKIASNSSKGAIENIAIPAYDLDVYREATIINSSETAILPGPVSIFSNGNFIGRQSFSFIPAGKELKLPVGRSEQVLVSRKLVEKFEDDSGLVRSFRRIRYKYQIELENISSVAQMAIILEPRPISRNEKIKVELTKESIKSLDLKDKSRVQADDGIFEWHLQLTPKSKQKIDYEFVVEFEADVPVSGLDSL